MRWVDAIDRRLAQAERALLVAVCAALVLLMMAQVVLRYVFSAPLFWAEEAAVQLLVLMTLCMNGAAIWLRYRLRRNIKW